MSLLPGFLGTRFYLQPPPPVSCGATVTVLNQDRFSVVAEYSERPPLNILVQVPSVRLVSLPDRPSPVSTDHGRGPRVRSPDFPSLPVLLPLPRVVLRPSFKAQPDSLIPEDPVFRGSFFLGPKVGVV